MTVCSVMCGIADAQQGPVFIPLWFAPNEAYQFDWSHEVMVLGGVTTPVKLVHIRFCHNRMFLVQANPCETQEMVFDAPDHTFRLFGGMYRDRVPGRGVRVRAGHRDLRRVWPVVRRPRRAA